MKSCSQIPVRSGWDGSPIFQVARRVSDAGHLRQGRRRPRPRLHAIIRTVHYREHPPAPALRAHVACYWMLRGHPSPTAGHRVLPDGCLDLLFDLRTGAAHVIGIMTAAIVSVPAPPVDLLGVRFLPGEAAAYLGLAARDTRDRAIALPDVCGRWGHALAERLREVAPEHRSAVLDEALLARGRRCPPDRRLRGAVDLLHRSRGKIAIAALAGAVGLGERQLERLFDEHVGIGPKVLGRVVRVQALVARLDALAPREHPRWAALAADLGWSDQAHLVRDVGRLAGVTPGALLRERAGGRHGVSEFSNPPAAIVATVGL